MDTVAVPWVSTHRESYLEAEFMTRSLRVHAGFFVLATLTAALVLQLILLDARVLAIQVEGEQRAEQLLSQGLIDRARANEALASVGSSTRLSVEDPSSPVGNLEFQRRFLALGSIGPVRAWERWILCALGLQGVVVVLLWRNEQGRTKAASNTRGRVEP